MSSRVKEKGYPPPPRYCNVCERKFHDLRSLNSHLIEDHLSSKYETAGVDDERVHYEEKTRKTNRAVTDVDYNDENGYIDGEREEVENIIFIACKVCKTYFEDEEEYMNHERTKHENSSNYDGSVHREYVVVPNKNDDGQIPKIKIKLQTKQDKRRKDFKENIFDSKSELNQKPNTSGTPHKFRTRYICTFCNTGLTYTKHRRKIHRDKFHGKEKKWRKIFKKVIVPLDDEPSENFKREVKMPESEKVNINIENKFIFDGTFSQGSVKNADRFSQSKKNDTFEDMEPSCSYNDTPKKDKKIKKTPTSEGKSHKPGKKMEKIFYCTKCEHIAHTYTEKVKHRAIAHRESMDDKQGLYKTAYFSKPFKAKESKIQSDNTNEFNSQKRNPSSAPEEPPAKKVRIDPDTSSTSDKPKSNARMGNRATSTDYRSKKENFTTPKNNDSPKIHQETTANKVEIDLVTPTTGNTHKDNAKMRKRFKSTDCRSNQEDGITPSKNIDSPNRKQNDAKKVRIDPDTPSTSNTPQNAKTYNRSESSDSMSCDKRKLSKDNLTNPKQRRVSEGFDQSDDKEQEVPHTIFQCARCCTCFINRDIMNAHLDKCTKTDRTSCVRCSLWFSSKDLVPHMQRDHKDLCTKYVIDQYVPHFFQEEQLKDVNKVVEDKDNRESMNDLNVKEKTVSEKHSSGPVTERNESQHVERGDSNKITDANCGIATEKIEKQMILYNKVEQTTNNDKTSSSNNETLSSNDKTSLNNDKTSSSNEKTSSSNGKTSSSNYIKKIKKTRNVSQGDDADDEGSSSNDEKVSHTSHQIKKSSVKKTNTHNNKTKNHTKEGNKADRNINLVSGSIAKKFHQLNISEETYSIERVNEISQDENNQTTQTVHNEEKLTDNFVQRPIFEGSNETNSVPKNAEVKEHSISDKQTNNTKSIPRFVFQDEDTLTWFNEQSYNTGKEPAIERERAIEKDSEGQSQLQSPWLESETASETLEKIQEFISKTNPAHNEKTNSGETMNRTKPNEQVSTNVEKQTNYIHLNNERINAILRLNQVNKSVTQQLAKKHLESISITKLNENSLPITSRTKSTDMLDNTTPRAFDFVDHGIEVTNSSQESINNDSFTQNNSRIQATNITCGSQSSEKYVVNIVPLTETNTNVDEITDEIISSNMIEDANVTKRKKYKLKLLSRKQSSDNNTQVQSHSSNGDKETVLNTQGNAINNGMENQTDDLETRNTVTSSNANNNVKIKSHILKRFKETVLNEQRNEETVNDVDIIEIKNEYDVIEILDSEDESQQSNRITESRSNRNEEYLETDVIVKEEYSLNDIRRYFNVSENNRVDDENDDFLKTVEEVSNKIKTEKDIVVHNSVINRQWLTIELTSESEDEGSTSIVFVNRYK